MTDVVRVQKRQYQCHAHIIVDVVDNPDEGLPKCSRRPRLVKRQERKYLILGCWVTDNMRRSWQGAC